MAATEALFNSTFKAAIAANDFNLAWTIWNQQVTDNAAGTSRVGMTNFWTDARQHMTPAQRGFGAHG